MAAVTTPVDRERHRLGHPAHRLSPAPSKCKWPSHRFKASGLCVPVATISGVLVDVQELGLAAATATGGRARPALKAAALRVTVTSASGTAGLDDDVAADDRHRPFTLARPNRCRSQKAIYAWCWAQADTGGCGYIYWFV